MASQHHSLLQPSTPPRRQKAHSIAPLLQRAGHASLTFQPPPRYSDASSGLLTSPTSPFDEPSSLPDTSLSFQRKLPTKRTLPSRKVNAYSSAIVFKPALLNHWPEPFPQPGFASSSLTFSFHEKTHVKLDTKSIPNITSEGRVSRASHHSDISTSQSEHTGELSHPSRRSGLSETSRTLLTQFPVPPKLPQPASDSSTQGTPNEPKTPNIAFQQHYQTIDIELQHLAPSHEAGYSSSPAKLFTRKYSLPKPPPRLEKALPLLPAMADTKTRTTPPRAIFKDFTTAYQSIKSKSARNLYDASPIQELPLPPVPAQMSPVSTHSRSKSSAVAIEAQPTNPELRSTFWQRLSAGPESAKHGSTIPQSPDNEQISLGLSRAVLGRHRRQAAPVDVFARFSMPEVSKLYDNDMSSYIDNLNLLNSSGQVDSSLSSRRDNSDQESQSTSAGSHDSAEDFIDSYATKLEPQRPYTSRRYTAMPRLQHVRSGLTDVTTSTIGDLLSQYGEPEFRSLPTSISQRFQAVGQSLHHDGHEGHEGREAHEDQQDEVCVGEDGVDLKNLIPENPFESPDDEKEILRRPRKPPPAALAESLARHPAFIKPGLTLVDSTPLIDYGDTKELLELSSSSLDIARGVAPSRPARFSLGQRSSSNRSLLDIDSVMRSHSSSDHLIIQDSSESTTEKHIPQGRAHMSDVRTHLQPLSVPELASLQPQTAYSSNRVSKTEVDLLGGNVGNTENAQSYRPARDSAISQSASLRATKKPSQLLQYLEEQRIASHVNALETMRQPPIAAFTSTNVMPGVYRFSPSKETSTTQQDSDQLVEDIHMAAHSQASDEEDEWETMTESRRTIQGHASVSHSVNAPSIDHTYRTLNNVGIHPADQRYKHVYRLHSPPGSAESVLVPSYDLGPASNFPYQNNSRTVARSTSAYGHPAGDSAQDHGPLSNSPSSPPVPTSAFSQTSFSDSVSFEDENDYEDDHPVPYGIWRGPNLSVVYEQSGEKSETDLALPAPSVLATAPSVVVSQAIDDGDRSSAWVDCGPGPEVSSNGDGSAWQHLGRDGLPTSRSKQTILTSGADASLIKDLRGDESSSYLTTTNSFAKTTKLGPYGNLTGSFNGTNMRFVGSSVIGSSSVVSPSNSVQQTPNRYEAPQPATESSSSLVEEIPSSVSWHRPRSYMIPKNKWSMAVPKPRPSSKHAVRISSSAETSHAAVASQRALIEVRKAQSQSPNVMTSISRPKELFGRVGHTTERHQADHLTMPRSPMAPQDRTPDTLLPIANPRAQLLSPHLHRLYRAPSSQVEGLKSTKQKLSWLVFAIFVLFPPLLIFYGHNMFEPLMLWMTKGRIEHFGRRPKEIGKYVGYLLTGSILLGLGIAMIVIRTVPNNLPR